MFFKKKKKEKYIGTLPDWIIEMNKLYDSPNDWSTDNRKTEEYCCPHCGAPKQHKVICEYCSSRNDIFILNA